MANYPDKHLIAAKTDLAVYVLKVLASLTIEVSHVDFNPKTPEIEVMHCPGVRNLIDVFHAGQGVTAQGSYQRKCVDMKGCRIFWNEFS